MENGLSELGLLGFIHPIQINCHQQGADLIVRDCALSDAVDKKLDLVACQSQAIAFLSDDVLWSQTVSPSPSCFGLPAVISTTACAPTASPRPTASIPSPVFALTLTTEGSTASTCAMFSRIEAT